MDIDDLARLAKGLAGVCCTAPEGLAEWRYHGRLVARQLDDMHVVIRAGFDYRDSMLTGLPGVLVAVATGITPFEAATYMTARLARIVVRANGSR